MPDYVLGLPENIFKYVILLSKVDLDSINI